MRTLYTVVLLATLTPMLAVAQTPVVNEILADNETILADDAGEYDDWIEIYNPGSSELQLAGMYFSDDFTDPQKFHLLPSDSSQTLVAPHGFLVLWCDGDPEQGPRHLDFSLGASGEEILITAADGSTLLEHIEFGQQQEDISIGRVPDGSSSIVSLTEPSPGASNGGGVLGIQINEFLCSNDSLLMTSDGEDYDWIELYNPLSTSLDGSEFYLSDDPAQPLMWQMPAVSIPAGQFFLVWASGLNSRDPEEAHTNFKLSSDSGFIGIYNALGEMQDCVSYDEQRCNISYGRPSGTPQEWAYFDVVTPLLENPTQGYAGFTPNPGIALPSGFYSGSVQVALQSNGGSVYWTTDGSVPDAQDDAYASPLTLNESTVVRARAFQSGLLPSRTVTCSYLLGFETDLPVVSLSMDPVDLWSDSTGIYVLGPNAEDTVPYFGANFWQDWEKAGHFEYFVNENRVADVDLGVKIAGNWSRYMPQKSMNLHCRSRYGGEDIEYPIFPDSQVNVFSHIKLRSSSQDYNRSKILDAYAQGLAKELDLEDQSYQPCVMFLNGQYWGIMNIRDKVGGDYLAYRQGVDPDRVDILDNTGTLINIVEGNNAAFQHLLNYLENHSLVDLSAYQYVESCVDIDEYIDYLIVEIFSANWDWPGNNHRFWRSQDGGRWRWILFDVDAGFFPSMLEENMLNHLMGEDEGPYNPPATTLLFRRLVENQEFCSKFIHRCSDILETCYEPGYADSLLDAYADRIESEIPRHLERWDSSGRDWAGYVESLRTFTHQRVPILQQQFVEFFELEGLSSLTLSCEPATGGWFEINQMTPVDGSWSGTLFAGITNRIKAVPHTGFRFVAWSDGEVHEERVLDLDPGVTDLVAIFESLQTPHFMSEGVYFGNGLAGDSLVALVTVSLEGTTSDTLALVTPSWIHAQPDHFTLLEGGEQEVTLTAAITSAEAQLDDLLLSTSSGGSASCWVAANVLPIVTEFKFQDTAQEVAGDWVELYNPYATSIHLDDWVLHDSNMSHSFALHDACLDAGAYLVLAEDIDAFIGVYGENVPVIGSFDFGLSSSSDCVRLTNPQGQLLVDVCYSNGTPWPELAPNTGYSFELFDIEGVQDDPANWIASSEALGSPGLASGSTLLPVLEMDGAMRQDTLCLASPFLWDTLLVRNVASTGGGNLLLSRTDADSLSHRSWLHLDGTGGHVCCDTSLAAPAVSYYMRLRPDFDYFDTYPSGERYGLFGWNTNGELAEFTYGGLKLLVKGAGTEYYLTFQPMGLVEGEWCDMLLTLNSAAGLIDLYINGVLEYSMSVAPWQQLERSTFRFGRRSSPSIFKGDIESFALWNQALGVEEVTLLAQGMQPQYLRREVLVASYQFDRFEGNFALDDSPNKLNGQLVYCTPADHFQMQIPALSAPSSVLIHSGSTQALPIFLSLQDLDPGLHDLTLTYQTNDPLMQEATLVYRILLDSMGALPTQLRIIRDNNHLRLEWESVQGASYYRVECRSDFNGGWSLLTQTNESYLDLGVVETMNRAFYRVTAISDTVD